MASLDARLERLEERRLQEAVGLIFERARGAGLNDVARFLSAGFELEQQPQPDEAAERHIWAHLGIPLEVIRVAEAAPGQRWCSGLGDLLADKRGLRSFLWEHYPSVAAELYGPRFAEG